MKEEKGNTPQDSPENLSGTETVNSITSEDVSKFLASSEGAGMLDKIRADLMQSIEIVQSSDQEALKTLEKEEEKMARVASSPHATKDEKKAAQDVVKATSAFRNTLSKAKNFGYRSWDWAKRSLKRLYGRFKALLHAAWGWVKGLTTALARAIGTAIGALVNIGRRAINAVGRGLSHVWDCVCDVTDRTARIVFPTREDDNNAMERELAELAMKEARSRAAA